VPLPLGARCDGQEGGFDRVESFGVVPKPGYRMLLIRFLTVSCLVFMMLLIEVKTRFSSCLDYWSCERRADSPPRRHGGSSIQ
jgi:hypothetical protein